VSQRFGGSADRRRVELGRPGEWHEVLADRIIEGPTAGVPDLFAGLPVALLVAT